MSAHRTLTFCSNYSVFALPFLAICISILHFLCLLAFRSNGLLLTFFSSHLLQLMKMGAFSMDLLLMIFLVPIYHICSFNLFHYSLVLKIIMYKDIKLKLAIGRIWFSTNMLLDSDFPMLRIH